MAILRKSKINTILWFMPVTVILFSGCPVISDIDYFSPLTPSYETVTLELNQWHRGIAIGSECQ